MKANLTHRPRLVPSYRRRVTTPTRCLRARAGANESMDFSAAPSKPSTPYGKMLAYYLQMEPRLFESAVHDQFTRLKEERDRQKSESGNQSSGELSTSTDLTLSSLSSRIQEVQEKERRATVEDLMYMCILEEFMKLNVDLLPKMDNYTDVHAMSLTPLMEGMHTLEALDMVREHMMALLGQTAMLPPTATVKMSKLQMAQVYAASVMFGYFLRRVDKRFQLAKSLGMLPEDKEDVVARLGRIFSLNSDEGSRDEDPEKSASPPRQDSSESASSSSSNEQPKQPALRKYIETFDQDTLRNTARMMSMEGLSLLDRQSTALWGEANELQAEMQKAIGLDVTSMAEVMKRAEEAVANDTVQTVTMSLATQRRAVLEAVAFGSFLRDVENHVDEKYGLLTPLPARNGPGGGGPPGMLSA